MAKHFVLVALSALLVYGQSSPAPLTNETIIRLVASGVPTGMVINTIRVANAVSFTFLPGDLELLQRYHVPDDVVKIMSAKSYGKPIPRVSATSVQISSPQLSTPGAKASPTPTPSPESLTNESLVTLVKAGMDEDTLVGIVNSQPGRYELSKDALIALKQAGVSDKIITAAVNRYAGSTWDQESAQKSFAAAQRDQNVGLVAADVPRSTRLEPRVFLQSASKGTNQSAARDQSMEMSKDLEKNCPGERITLNQQVADYTVLLNHIKDSFVARDNQLQVANKDGDLIAETMEGVSIAAGMKKSCALILADWAKR